MGGSPGFRRMVAVGLLVLMAVALWRFAVDPLRAAWVADREAVAAHRDAIARFRGIAAAREDYESALGELRAQSGTTDALIRATSPTLAAAQLQQRVKSLVETAGGSLVSAQPGDSETAGPFERVELGVRMLVSVTALQRVLHDLESGTPLVVIEQMQVLTRRGRAPRRRTRGQAQPARTAPQLDVRLTLGAFVAAAAQGEQG